QDWLLNSSLHAEVRRVKARLEQEQLPAIAPLIDQCSTFSDASLIVLDAGCIARAKIHKPVTAVTKWGMRQRRVGWAR
ncbi:MAG TPA: hypothetical protein ACFE0H_01710, partial [Elainellaceae cyanobacterium]